MSDSQQSITVLEELFRKLETATSETRESKQKALNTLGAVAYIANETNLSPSVEPYIVATVPSVCSKAGSKDNDVQLAATKRPSKPSLVLLTRLPLKHSYLI
ncbi:BEM_collapsed_G0048590.mRNA.1.CDS.1 [Saccharomyces cerevisiae]|nr:BEM_collapsed_G0048590.mRNA.1.CDS.1 [Saccharomyces cerevisiae]